MKIFILALIAVFVATVTALSVSSDVFACESCITVSSILERQSESESRCGIDVEADSWANWDSLFNELHGVYWVETQYFNGNEFVNGYWKVPTFKYFEDGIWCINQRENYNLGTNIPSPSD